MTTDSAESGPWVTAYDVSLGWCTIAAATQSSHHWSDLTLDPAASDPDQLFFASTDNDSEHVLVRTALGADGPRALHENFNVEFLGSMTLWPHHPHPYVWGYENNTLWRSDSAPGHWTPVDLGLY